MRSGFGSVTGYSRKGGQIKHSDLHIEPVSELNVKNIVPIVAQWELLVFLIILVLFKCIYQFAYFVLSFLT